MWPAAAPAALRPIDSVAPAASAAAFLATPASSTPIGSLECSHTTPARMNTLAIVEREPLVERGGDQPGALGDHLARVRGPADAGHAPVAERRATAARSARCRRAGRGPWPATRPACGGPGRPRAGRRSRRPARARGRRGTRSRRATRPAETGSTRISRGSSTPAQVGLVLAVGLEAPACSAVRVCSVVRKPPRASRTATAVPNEPAPTTTARRAPASAARGAGAAASDRTAPRRASSGGELGAERSPAASSSSSVRRLDHALEVDDPLAERVERVACRRSRAAARRPGARACRSRPPACPRASARRACPRR